MSAPTAGLPGGNPLPPVDDARFVPGAVLDRRYRIISLLGRGGMGEVYRADDLKLGQPVALKFLPRDLDQDPERLRRLVNEVRTARQIAHANVCRVYDIGEFDGNHYLSMEYVSGEDLASLLRRIGRLPKNKAMQIGRQLCAGLHAVHEQGILHRDLKPANVMIDGRGQVKITDFGLAGLESTFAGEEIRVGTPGYMSPEQLAGTELSVGSDIYSLGLVLYELYTGKRPFEAASATELARMQRDAKPTSPAAHVEGLDRAIDNAILRCLEVRPEDRPASALALAATMPGGDALAAALAAGETPSPEMVANAGDVGGLPPALASTILGLTVAALLAIAWGQGKTTVLGQVAPEKPPEALAADARAIVHLAGYDAQPADTVVGYATDAAYMEYRQDNGITEDIAAVRPSPLHFWFRQSPEALLVTPNVNNAPVSWDDPPLRIPGEIRVRLDPKGRLLVFQAVPPSWVEDDLPAPEPDWSDLFDRAGLAMERLRPSPPRWNPLQSPDERAAWEGTYSDVSESTIRVEAGSYRGRPVYFRVFPAWVTPGPAGTTAGAGSVVERVLLLFILLGAGILARRNLRLGRADRRGAFRLACGLFVLLMTFWALLANHVPDAAAILLVLIPAVSIALGWSAFLGYVLWVAVEPSVRRVWPEVLISWSRLLDGRFRDPMVGRDLLVGAFAGVTIRLLQLYVAWSTGSITPLANFGSELIGVRFAMGVTVHNVYWSVVGPLLFTTVLLLLRILLRRRWLAGLVWIAFFSLFFSLSLGISGPGVLGKIVAVASATICLLVLVRSGFLAAASLGLFGLSFHTLTLDLSKWYAGQSLLVLSILAAIAVYGFHSSLAGRPVFTQRFLDAGAAPTS